MERLKRAIPKTSNLPREIGVLLNKSPNTVQRQMRGQINIPLDEYLKIARAFGVAIDPSYPLAEDAISHVSEPPTIPCERRFTTDYRLLLAQLLWLSRQFNTQIRMTGGDLPWYWALNSPRLFSLLEPEGGVGSAIDAAPLANQLQRTLDRLEWEVLHVPNEMERMIRRLLLEFHRGHLDRDTCADELEMLRFGVARLGHQLREGEKENRLCQPTHVLARVGIPNPLFAFYCDGRLHHIHVFIEGLGLIRSPSTEHSMLLQSRIDEWRREGTKLIPENSDVWEVQLQQWNREIDWGLDRLLSSEIPA